jgi:HprK-related kinase A
MGLESEWVHRTPNLSALSYRFAVRTDDVSVGGQVDEVLAGLRDHLDAAYVEHWYSLTAVDADGDTVDVARDGEILAQAQQSGDALGWVVWDVNRAAAEAGADHLLFHSGAVEADGTGVLLPGASGSGKSTLTAGLVRAGLGYLTDELAALDLASGRLLPYPKPITVKPGSFAVLADIGPDGRLAPGSRPWAGQEWQVAVGEGTGRAIGTPCEPGFVIVPHYDAGAETTLTPLSDTQAFFALAVNAVNLVAHGSAGTRALGRLAHGCQCFSLAFSDLDEACRLVLELVAAEATGVRAATAVLGGAGRGA